MGSGLDLTGFSLLFQRAWQWELDLGPLENPRPPHSKVPGKTQSCFFCVPLPLELVCPTLSCAGRGWRSMD